MPLTFTPVSGDALSFTIDFDRFDCEDFFRGTGRWQYQCTINVDDETIDAGLVRSGVTIQDNPERLGSMLATFLNMFAAFAEAGPNSENYEMFPSWCRPIANALDASQIGLWADEINGIVSEPSNERFQK